MYIELYKVILKRGYSNLISSIHGTTLGLCVFLWQQSSKKMIVARGHFQATIWPAHNGEGITFLFSHRLWLGYVMQNSENIQSSGFDFISHLAIYGHRNDPLTRHLIVLQMDISDCCVHSFEDFTMGHLLFTLDFLFTECSQRATKSFASSPIPSFA